MKLGIGSHTFGWRVGIPGHIPTEPMNAVQLLEWAKLHDVTVVQIADNMPLHKMRKSEPITDAINPNPKMIFAPNLSINFPEIGAPIPAKIPRINTKYPPLPEDIFIAFSENCGTKIIPMITIPVMNDKINVITILRFLK